MKKLTDGRDVLQGEVVGNDKCELSVIIRVNGKDYPLIVRQLDLSYDLTIHDDAYHLRINGLLRGVNLHGTVTIENGG